MIISKIFKIIRYSLRKKNTNLIVHQTSFMVFIKFGYDVDRLNLSICSPLYSSYLGAYHNLFLLIFKQI